MGLIKAAMGAVGGVVKDQWKEYFYCEALTEDVIAAKGQKRATGRSSNTKGEENIISTGSAIAVADGQCMIIVEQGKVLDVCAEPGEYVFDIGGEPSLFAGGDLQENAVASFKSVWERFKFGGSPGKDTRIYYFNTKELIGNKYGTPNPVPFRVVDANINLDIDIAIRCFGEYSYRITNPILFYANVCGNVTANYVRGAIEGQMKTELMTALQPAFARISAMGIRYSALPGHTLELAVALNEVLSSKWRDLRGIEIVSFGVSSVNASKEDEDMIKNLQKSAVMRDPNMAAAILVGAQADAMRSASANEGGAMMGFMGLGMAQQAGGMNAQSLFGMERQTAPAPQNQYAAAPGGGFGTAGQPAAPLSKSADWACFCGHTGNTGKFCTECAAPIPRADSWTCTCGHSGNTGKFCSECAKPKSQADSWTCSCGHANNTGKFCAECAKPKPAGISQYKCDKCGWTPEDPAKPPKFCPECADPFEVEDII